MAVLDTIYCSYNLKFNTHSKTDLIRNPHTVDESDLWLRKDQFPFKEYFTWESNWWNFIGQNVRHL